MISVNKGVWDKAATFEEIHEFNKLWLRECRRLLKPDGAIWVTGTAHNIYSVGFALQTLGFKVLNDIAWYKVNPPPNLSCRYFTHATETILWARRDPKSRHTFNYAEMKRENRDKQMQSLWHIKPPAAREKRYGKHPTQKPELTHILQSAGYFFLLIRNLLMMGMTHATLHTLYEIKCLSHKNREPSSHKSSEGTENERLRA
ncbi:MAG TPA: site-specific DNA-methyltransferase [Pyrinomonadaceae bacterium]|jgi:site-specific DNA-methyltransferase (adenine-specific)